MPGDRPGEAPHPRAGPQAQLDQAEQAPVRLQGEPDDQQIHLEGLGGFDQAPAHQQTRANIRNEAGLAVPTPGRGALGPTELSYERRVECQDAGDCQGCDERSGSERYRQLKHGDAGESRRDTD